MRDNKDPRYASPEWAMTAVTKARWGRKIIVGDEGGNAWFAREDNENGIPVVFSDAPVVRAAIKNGAVGYKDCGECLTRALTRSDDYICINCRGDDPFLDDGDGEKSPGPYAGCPDCNGTGMWHECGRTQVCNCVDFPF